MNAFECFKSKLRNSPKVWLVTGVAGFIGSNLLEELLKLEQHVVGLDNFSTGHQRNLDEVKMLVSKGQWERFRFVEGDICDLDICHKACYGVDFVLHHAALGSVPCSIENPISSNQSNVDGFLNILVAARDAKISRLVYAASSSTYGDHPGLPKIEDKIGSPLSPYAVTKLVNELYAEVFARTYNFSSIGLRYFNIFGKRQDPDGAYAAVIPRWIAQMIEESPVFINGDGTTSRDFCYIDNVIQANILAALTSNRSAINQVYNIAVGECISLDKLYFCLRNNLAHRFPGLKNAQPAYRGFRNGDIQHSLADIEKAKTLLGFEPTHTISDGLTETIDWYIKFLSKFKFR